MWSSSFRPPPQLGKSLVEVSGLGMEIAGKKLFSGFSFTFERSPARRPYADAMVWAKSTLPRIIIGQLAPSEAR